MRLVALVQHGESSHARDFQKAGVGLLPIKSKTCFLCFRCRGKRRISMDLANLPLDLTEEHLLFRADGSTVPAYAVQCNDELASGGGRIAVVNSVRRSKSLGYSPLIGALNCPQTPKQLKTIKTYNNHKDVFSEQPTAKLCYEVFSPD